MSVQLALIQLYAPGKQFKSCNPSWQVKWEMQTYYSHIALVVQIQCLKKQDIFLYNMAPKHQGFLTIQNFHFACWLWNLTTT